MNRTRFLPSVSVAFALCAAVAATGLRTISYLTYFDNTVGYFDSSVTVVLETVLCFMAVLVPTVCMLCMPQNVLPDTVTVASRDYPAVLPFGALLAYAFAIFSNRSAFAAVQLSPAGSETAFSSAMTLSAVLALFGALYAFLRLFGVKSQTLIAGIGFFIIFWSILLVGVTYLDQYITMNSPLKIGVQMGLLGIAVAMTAELRFVLNKGTPRAYIVLTCAGAFFGLDSGVSYVIAALTQSVRSNLSYTLISVAEACMGLYFAIRLILFIRLSRADRNGTDADKLDSGNSEPDNPTNDDTDTQTSDTQTSDTQTSDTEVYDNENADTLHTDSTVFDGDNTDKEGINLCE